MSKQQMAKRPAATTSLVRQKMAMFEKMAAGGRVSADDEDMPRPPKLGNLVKSRHEWIMKQQSKGFSSPDPLVNVHRPSGGSAVGGGSGSECRNDHVKLVTKNVHQTSDDERDPVDASSAGAASSSVPDPVFLAAAEEEATAVAAAAPVPEICFGLDGDDADGSVGNPMDVSVLAGGDEPVEEAPGIAYFVKHNRSLTRVTVIDNASRGNTPVNRDATPSVSSSKGSVSRSAKSADLAPPVSPTTFIDALVEDEEAFVEEGKECDSMINEFDLVRVDSTAFNATSHPIKWCSETLLITEEEWDAVPKIDKDAVWKETKKPIKWCLDTLLIDNTL